MSYQIGVDGGGTKTECVLVDLAGHLVATSVGPGCNPSAVGPERATALINAALAEIRARAAAHFATTHGHDADPASLITSTLLCMAGARSFWRDLARDVRGYGQVTTTDDSLPVLELATHGQPGLVLHAGTGSFAAARGLDGSIHYAGGLGWRFGDPGSGYDIGRRAVSQGLLELQGWAPPSKLGHAVREHAPADRDTDASGVTRIYYQHPEPNRHIAALAPAVLQFAAEGDTAAREIVLQSAAAFLDFAVSVAARIFPRERFQTLPAGLSGPILNHPFVREAITARAPFVLTPITASPIEGVRRLLARNASR
jgi:N-acetylglucosamine kinase-like BadF-type ATPase